MIKAVLFDYNGVLVDDLDIHLQAYMDTFKDNNVDITEPEFRKILSLAPEEKIRIALGQSFSDELMKKILSEKKSHYYEGVSGRNIIFPGVEKTIKALHGKYRLAIISNAKRCDIEQVFSEHIDFFDYVVTYEDTEKPKPDPSSLLATAEKLNVTQKECVYIGDAPSDMQAAKAAGMQGLGVATGNT